MEKTKALIFDMDGTIVDFYAIDNWLEKIRNEDISPYVEASPIYDMDTLGVIASMFQSLGYRIVVVSWGSKGASKEYNKAVRKAKLDWLQRYGFPYDELHVVKYGTPKQKFIKDDLSILIDDSDKVLADFLKSSKGNEKRVIDAKHNIMKALIDILVA